MPPMPNTATVSPGRTGTTLAATPYPVDTAHPTSAASGAGSPAAGTTCSARTTVAPANDATLA